jgi:hypothetical protein
MRCPSARQLGAKPAAQGHSTRRMLRSRVSGTTRYPRVGTPVHRRADCRRGAVGAHCRRASVRPRAMAAAARHRPGSRARGQPGSGQPWLSCGNLAHGRRGASDGTRTHGIQDHNLALCQLSYARHRKGWVCGVSGWRRQHVARANKGRVSGKRFSGGCTSLPSARHADADDDYLLIASWYRQSRL